MVAITGELLDRLTAEARNHPRRRKNFNLHPSDGFCCHRLLNAVEPGSYVAPHCHLDPAKDESMIILRGCLGIVTFDAAGNVTDRQLLRPGGDTVAVDLPHGSFHSIVSLESGTVFFEAKAGPYLPLAAAEKAGWAPAEGDPGAVAYLAALEGLFHQS